MTAHRHPYSTPNCTEVGPSVCLTPTWHGGDPDVTESATGAIAGGPVEHLYGYIVAYDWPGSDTRLEGAVKVDTCRPDGDEARWEMTGTLEGHDLTLRPSIQAYDSRERDAHAHPTIHGYVTDGVWVPA